MASNEDLPENDENLQPSALNVQDRPNDHDRARFGFKLRPSPAKLPEAQKVVKKDAISPSREIDLQRLFRETIGDPDDLLPVLKLKPTAGKYDFKDKIADLQGMITPLKNALSDQRVKAKAFEEVVAGAEEEVNAKLASLREDLKEAAARLASTQREAAGREAVLAKQLSQESSRAARLKQDLEEARSVASHRAEDVASMRRRCEEMSERHRAQMEEAASMLRRQVDETMQAKEQLVEAHRKKEAALLADFSKAKEALKHEYDHRLNELERSLRLQDSEAKEALKKLEAALEAKDARLREQEHEAKNCIASLKRTHGAELAEREAIQVQKEDELRSVIDSLKKSHEEREAAHKQKENELNDFIEQATQRHQLLLSEKEKVHKQKEDAAQVAIRSLEKQLVDKEHETRECIDSLTAAHQRVLEDKDNASKLKEGALQAAVQSLKQQLDDKDATLQSTTTALQSKLVEKEQQMKKAHETFWKEKEASFAETVGSLRQQLVEKEATLRETLQSMQFLQTSTGEQLQWERRRVQSLEDEVARLRGRAEDLRSSELAFSNKAKQLESELGFVREQLQTAETERDLQIERASEQQAVLQEELAQSRARMSCLQEELASLKAWSSARQLQCEQLAHERDALEVEFRSYKEHHGTSNQQQMEAITELKLTVDKLSKQVDFTKAELHNQQGNLSRHQGYIQSLENQLATAESTRRELHNAIQELKGNIRVYCRIRPPAGNAPLGSHLQLGPENKLNLDYMNEMHGFSFDRVFPDTSSQEAVFEEVGGLVQSALDGYKVSIFAYGQTGSGKTYTMQGCAQPGALGLIPRSIQQILKSSESMRASGWTWTLKVSFVEVYNEALRDLLGSDGSNLVHVIKHSDAWGTVVTNLTMMEVSSMDQINKLMETAAKSRAVGATDMNATSSRSHSVFALYLHGVNHEQHSELHGALHLVDLAGSERLDKSGSTGDRLKETQNINRSLSSLADVFLAKAEGRSHIPFRNSKLTHLMEPCLNGHGKTLMLVTVSPEEDHSHETLCSLRFASQVSQCTTGGKPKRHLRAVANPSASGPKLQGSRSAIISRNGR